VLVVGAGSMGALAGATLRRHGVAEVVVANRTAANAARLATSLEGRGVGLDALVDEVAAADVVITSTGAIGHVVEREVVAEAEGCDLLILARDGDRSHLGPRSLGPASRFVVDHAPCPVLLVWPEPSPDLSTMPPPPPRP
jgi:nucleotide-binding universal stress UspA family protein